MSETDWKVVLALLGALVGWVLAQGAAAGKFWWRRRWLRKHLLLELEDLKEDLGQTLIHYEGLIKVAAIDGILAEGRVPLEAPIYNAFFTEAYSGLNRAQRRSYKITHAQIRAVNEGIEDVRNMLLELDPRGVTKEELKKRGADWMEMVKGQYLNVSRAYAHVHFHLTNIDAPDLGGPYGEVAQWFGRHDHKAADNVVEFIKFSEGKTLAELRIHMADRKI